MTQPDLFDVGPRLLNPEARGLFAHQATPGKLYRPAVSGSRTARTMTMTRWF